MNDTLKRFWEISINFLMRTGQYTFNSSLCFLLTRISLRVNMPSVYCERGVYYINYSVWWKNSSSMKIYRKLKAMPIAGLEFPFLNCVHFFCKQFERYHNILYKVYVLWFSNILWHKHSLYLAMNFFLTFWGPCIVVYSYNKNNEMH